MNPTEEHDDRERLQALRDLNILDTPHEERYDRIVRMAQYVFQVPVALLALEDEHRQWMKASAGLEIVEVPRDEAFSSLPTLENDIIVVPDAREDERFSQYALVNGEPYARFFAGSVVRGRGGIKVGTLGIFDVKPRHLSEDEIERLRSLATWVELEFDQIERKRMEAQLRASEARFQLLADATIEGVAIHADGFFQEVNQQYATMFGYERPEDVVGRPAMSFLAPEDHDRIIEQMRADESRPLRWTAVRRDGTTFAAESEARSLTVHGSLVRVVAVRDVTLQDAAERSLREAHQKALEASQAKGQFLATMSHEIRTPLNAIIGMAELLNETALTPEQRRYVDIFQRSGDHLLKLINDILDLSKIEAGQFELEHIPLSVRDLMESVGEVIAMRAHAKGLEVAVHVAPGVPEEILGDPDRLRQIILNLAGNAVKFTEIGEVVVRAEVDPSSTHGDRLRFSVSDTGIGIPEDKMDAIFDSFTQADASTTRKYGGTGLGLGISKHLVEMMGGRIWVESVAEQGSQFFFTVPNELSSSLASATQWRSPALARVRILVVDDHSTNRFILKEMLTSLGARVDVASSGPEALVKLRAATATSNRYHLALLDARMPEMDGFDLAREIQGCSLEVAMMMLTSDNRTGDMSRAKQCGIAAYLVKPVKRAELLNVIGRLLQDVSTIDAPSTPMDPGARTNRGASHRILLADDSEDNRFLIQAYLSRTSYELTFAQDGLEAVRLFCSGEFDLVLMDVQMPELDGYEATRQIRAWESEQGDGRRVPILALTAHSLHEDQQKSMDAGCDHHLTKPIKKDVLLQALGMYLTPSAQRIRITVDRDLSSLIPGYLEHRRQDLLTVSQAMRDGDMQSIWTVAHQMKGSGGGYGFDAISELGAAMEQAAEIGDKVEIARILGELDQFLNTAEVVYD